MALGARREESVIPSIINTPNQQPVYRTNPAVPKISENCNEEGKIECDIHYEPDYGIRLRAEFSCDAIEVLDPCFGSFACICNSGYFSITSQMPEDIPEDYESFEAANLDILKVIKDELAAQKERERIEKLIEAESDEDEILGMGFILLASLCVVGLAAIILLIIAIYFLCRCCNKKKGANVSITPVVELSDKKGGPLAEKKRKQMQKLEKEQVNGLS